MSNPSPQGAPESISTGFHSKEEGASHSLPKGYISAKEARNRILKNQISEWFYTDSLDFEKVLDKFQLPPNLQVRGLQVRECPFFLALPEKLWADDVSIIKCDRFQTLPENVWISSLTIEGCKEFRSFPRPVSISAISIRGCNNLTELPPRLLCDTLAMPASQLRSIPNGVKASNTLELDGSHRLTSIPDFKTGILSLANCSSFRCLPDTLECDVLDLSGCTAFQWPEFSYIEVNRLILADCAQLSTLPDWLMINDAVDVANTSIKHLPPSLHSCRILWRGVEVDETIAFKPEEITSTDVINERNAERRRVMLERFGWGRFFLEVDHIQRDSDSDPGGERTLLEFIFDDDENLVVLSVSCPSTSRK